MGALGNRCTKSNTVSRECAITQLGAVRRSTLGDDKIWLRFSSLAHLSTTDTMELPNPVGPPPSDSRKCMPNEVPPNTQTPLFRSWYHHKQITNLLIDGLQSLPDSRNVVGGAKDLTAPGHADSSRQPKPILGHNEGVPLRRVEGTVRVPTLKEMMLGGAAAFVQKLNMYDRVDKGDVNHLLGSKSALMCHVAVRC